jgi:hypothetical protein
VCLNHADRLSILLKGLTKEDYVETFKHWNKRLKFLINLLTILHDTPLLTTNSHVLLRLKHEHVQIKNQIDLNVKTRALISTAVTLNYTTNICIDKNFQNNLVST